VPELYASGTWAERDGTASSSARVAERLNAAIGTMLAAGARSGSLRGDVPPDDVTSMLLGVFLSTAASGGSAEQRSRLLDLLVDGLRPAPGGE